jgi:hypothetical protein
MAVHGLGVEVDALARGTSAILAVTHSLVLWMFHTGDAGFTLLGVGLDTQFPYALFDLFRC